MLFNSYEFLFGFLPITVVVYFLFLERGLVTPAKLWLAGASLFFYSWWNPVYLPLLLASVGFNYGIARLLAREEIGARRLRTPIWAAGLCTNLGLLGYFKYADFFVENWNVLAGTQVALLHLVLPLGISFYTFQKIAYITDVYRGYVKPRSPVDYLLFVSFFPQLIAGPIVHHAELIPQFEAASTRRLDWGNVNRGSFQFVVGLFKKVVIADGLAPFVNHGFDVAPELTLVEAWVVSLCYATQLYFDFSGYCDMAMGAARLFNIELPVNFDSPYKSLDLQEFWRRWHVTLGRFLRDYVYVPLGGNRLSNARTYANLLVTFLIGGLWHGAGWTFVLWGFAHGAGLVVHRAWTRSGRALPAPAAWAVTFLFVNFAWVFFRAREWSDAVKVLRGMLGLEGVVMHAGLEPALGFLRPLGVGFGAWPGLPGSGEALPALAIALGLALLTPNSLEWTRRFQPTLAYKLATVALGLAAVLNLHRVSEFLYFQF